ncbi:MAG: efflux RND transporter periplasmic adaptor subunit [Betaproteobacteria bacterium]|nr:MAG: efflux RND transporter periplasmic adaptor subunit [Betaproteobacteria bacterium]
MHIEMKSRGLWRRCVVSLALALASPSALAQAATKGAPGAAPPPMPVKALAARVAPAIDETSALGTLRADEAITIRPEIAGRVAKILFAEGQGVKKGALLARLDSAELAAALASSQAQAGLDRQRLERAEDLHQKGFISQQALDEARSNYSRSAAKQSEDQAKLAKTEMRAAFGGVAGLRQVSEGAYVAAGTDIARLEKIDSLKLDFRVPELFLARVRAGQSVRIAVDAYAGNSFSGTIYAIEPAVDEQTRTVLVRARVGNADLRLRPGMFARVQLQLGVREKAVWVPEAAIVPRGQDSFVYRVADGKAALVKVRIGLRRQGEVEILDGISAGNLVVTEGVQKIGPGSPVVVVGEGTPKPAAAAGRGKKG